MTKNDAVPLQVGQAYYALNPAVISEIQLAPKEIIKITLADGTTLQGPKYVHWQGFAGLIDAKPAIIEFAKLPKRMTLTATTANP